MDNISIEVQNIFYQNTNSKCSDCFAENPTFSSLNNGLFICEKCAEIHKSTLDQTVSLVLPLSEIKDPKQVLFLKLGGNENYKKLMFEYHLISSKDRIPKYRSKFSFWYRKYLEQLVEKEINPNYVGEPLVKPDEKTGVEIEKTSMEKVQGFFKSSGEAINKKYTEIKNSETVHNISEKTSQGVSYVAEKTSQGASYLFGKVKGLFGSSNQ
jgi:hypothetical protein